MKLDERWANMVDNDQLLLVELMAARIEYIITPEDDGEFVAGMRYALELLQDKTILTQDSFTLFEEDK